MEASQSRSFSRAATALFLGLAAVLNANVACGQTTTPATSSTATKPAFVPAPLFDKSTITLRVLQNGVRGVVKQTRGTGLVAVQVWVRAGSRYETGNSAGASHLIEVLAMRASRDYPANGAGGGATDAIAALGGVATSMTARDSTNYSATVAATFLPAALRALGNATLHPRLGGSEVEAAKSEVETDLQRRASDPISTISDMAYSTAFGKHPYRNPAGGLPQNIVNLNSDRVRAYYTKRYVGSNISVVVVGDVNPASAHALIAQNFAAARKAPAAATPIAPETAPDKFKSATRKAGIARAAVALAFRAPGINTPKDVLALDVLQAHWNEGQDAVLRRVLLMNNGEDDDDASANANAGNGSAENGAAEGEPKSPAKPGAPEPLALGYDASFLTQRDPGLLILSVVVEPDNRSRAVKALLDEVTRVRANGIDATSLARAKKLLARQYVQQGETVSGQAGALGFYEMISTYEFAVTYLQRIEQVTGDDVKRVARTYLSPTNYVQVAVEPAPRPLPRPFPRQDGDSGGITA